jgi:hypothetical protein
MSSTCAPIHRASVSASPALRQTKHDARVMRSATTWVAKPPESSTALHRRREPALAVRERHDDVLDGPPRLDDLAVLRQRIVAERDA